MFRRQESGDRGQKEMDESRMTSVTDDFDPQQDARCVDVH